MAFEAERGKSRSRQNSNRRRTGRGTVRARGRVRASENALNMNVGNGQAADVGDGVDALVKEINDAYDKIIPASVVSKWKTEHLNADLLRNYVVSNFAYFGDTELTMGGLERLKEHFKINTSDD